MIDIEFRKVSKYLDTTIYVENVNIVSRLLSVSELESLVQTLKDDIVIMESHIEKFKLVDRV